MKPRQAGIRAIAEYLPQQVYDNEALARDFPALDPRKVLDKVGIARRTIAARDEFASDMACTAAEKLFASGACTPGDIDYLTRRQSRAGSRARNSTATFIRCRPCRTQFPM